MLWAELNGNDVSGRESLHGILSEQLKLPAWYGKNLDALFDCLTEPGEEISLTVRSWDALEETLGGYAKTFLNVLETAEQAGKRFHFTIDRADGGQNKETQPRRCI